MRKSEPFCKLKTPPHLQGVEVFTGIGDEYEEHMSYSRVQPQLTVEV